MSLKQPLPAVAWHRPSTAQRSSSISKCPRAAVGYRTGRHALYSKFAEKHYETLINYELHARSTDQVAEALLGYDAFADPDATHKIWGYLGVVKSLGLILDPHPWAGSKAGQLTWKQLGHATATSLILQYKRPEHLATGAAGQYHL